MTWFSEFDLKINPLDVRPNTSLIGLEKQEAQLRNHIEKEEICFLNGLTGSGKTSLLLKIQEEMPNHKFIYLDAHDLPDDFSLDDELRDMRSFFDKLWLRDFPSKTPVLIIDEFQATDPSIVLEARAKWENANERRIRSIVISQISKDLKNVAPSFKERLGSRIIMLSTLDDDDLKEMLRKRLDSKKGNLMDKLSPEALEFIVRCSGGNPRRLLEYTDEIFDFHHRKFSDRNPMLSDSYKVTYHGAKEVLGLEKVFVDGFSHLEGRKTAYETADGTPEIGFNESESKVLRLLVAGPKTISELARQTSLSEATLGRLVGSLKNRGAVLYAGKHKGKKRWQIEPSTKRRLVNV
jgi:hypothetical protein